mgnify:FL=1
MSAAATTTTDNRQQTADSRQQTADNRQQTTDSRQQTTDSRQQTADNRQQTTGNNTNVHSHWLHPKYLPIIHMETDAKGPLMVLRGPGYRAASTAHVCCLAYPKEAAEHSQGTASNPL